MVNYYKKIIFKNQEFKSKIYTIFLSLRILYFFRQNEDYNFAAGTAEDDGVTSAFCAR